MPRGLRSSFRRTNVSGLRRKVSWSGGPRGDINTFANEVVVFGTGQQANVDDLTIVRVRGELVLALMDGTVVDSQITYAFGMCVVSENAFNVGVTAVPAPFDDIAWDGWFVYHQGSVIFQGTLNTPSGGSNFSRVEIDSKAMRKTHATDVTVAVIQFHNEAGAVDLQVRLASRMLSKLP